MAPILCKNEYEVPRNATYKSNLQHHIFWFTLNISLRHDHVRLIQQMKGEIVTWNALSGQL